MVATQTWFKKLPKKGRGSCSLVGNEVDNLNGLVVTALSRAFEPSLQGCTFSFGGESIDLGEVFRNQIISKCKIISRQEFENLKISFKCFDPVQKSDIDFQFTQNHFNMVGEGFGLFKIAARDRIEFEYADAGKVQLSKKYQVLCDQTAFVGVIKQQDTATGQMLDFAIEIGKSITSSVVNTAI